MSFKVSREVRIVSWSTAVLYFGWGFGESLIPVFLYQFSKGYVGAGLLKSILDVVTLLTMPLIGYYADKISVKKMMLIGTGLYFLIAVNYYFAGALALVMFIVIARILNGLAWPLVSISHESYIYRYTPRPDMARTFGYFDTLSVVAWIIAVGLSLFLVDRFAIHQLLLLIAPAALLALIIVWFLPDDVKLKKIKPLKFSWQPYREVLKEIFFWPSKLRILILSSFLTSFVASAFFFYIPIEVWKTGSDLKQVIILAIFFGLPEALGNPLGWLVNKIKVDRAMIGSFLGTATVMIVSIFCNSFLWRLVAVTLVGIFMEIISLSRRQLIADYNIKSDFLRGARYGFGKINAVLGETISLGGLLGVIMVGVLINFTGWTWALIFLAASILFVFGLFLKKGIISKTPSSL